METITDRVSSITSVNLNNISLPRSIKLELSEICNHNCKYCVVPKHQYRKIFMSSDIFMASIEEMNRLGIKELGLFHMGEGTLHPELLEMVDYARRRSKDFEMFITTNGTAMLQLKGLVDRNIKSIKFSLNGYDRDSHLEATGVDDFELVMNNLEALVAYRNYIGSKTQISASSIYYNSKKQNIFADKVSRVVDKFYYTQLYNHAGKVDGKPVQLTNDIKILPNLCSKPCFGLFNLGHIKVDGAINMCRFGVDEEFNIGYIENGFDKAWFSEKAQEIRKRHLEDRIETCKQCLNFLNKA